MQLLVYSQSTPIIIRLTHVVILVPKVSVSFGHKVVETKDFGSSNYRCP